LAELQMINAYQLKSLFKVSTHTLRFWSAADGSHGLICPDLLWRRV